MKTMDISYIFHEINVIQMMHTLFEKVTYLKMTQLPGVVAHTFNPVSLIKKQR